MLSFSFRTKLIFAMTFVVASATGAAIWMTQKRVQKMYLTAFEDEFELQHRFFAEARLKQLDDVAKKCSTAAQAPDLITALEHGNPMHIYEQVRKSLGESFKTPEPVLPTQSMAARGTTGSKQRSAFDRLADAIRPKANALIAQTKVQAIPFMRVLNPDGTVIDPPDLRAATMGKAPGGAKRQEEMKAFLHLDKPLSEVLQEQEIGYKELDLGNPQKALHEIVVTPVRSPTKGLIGALAVGFIVRDFGEMQMYHFSKEALRSGVWIGGDIYTQTIPEANREEVAKRVAAELTGDQSLAKKPVIVDGVPHRVFYKILNPDSPFPPAAQVCLYSMADVLREQAELRNLAIGGGVAALLLGIGLILVISHGFSRPIEQLVRGTHRISEGDFDVKVPVQSRDEIGALASSFNHMAEGLAQKEKYRSVLAQVTDREVAEQLVSGQVALGGELREVSVLFCDIRGFTSHTEGMPPSEVITMLNEHMTAMNRVVHEHYGVVDKFVGDMIMAVFGAPKTYGNDALHAARCALAMIEERRALNGTSRHQIEIGIGVATGEAVAGCMGSHDRMNYTVLGERVNLASRLCSIAGEGEVLIDDATLSHLPPTTRSIATKPLSLKGFSETVSAFRLESLDPSIALPVAEEVAG